MSIKKTSNIRDDFSKSSIDFKLITKSPFKLFENWFEMALKSNKENAISFVLSTISKENKPSSRVVYLREFNDEGFIFYTNYDSDKAKDIKYNNFVSANFFWQKLEKQVRISGTARKITPQKSDTYFNGRPRNSQLGAWASNQSSAINIDEDFSSKINDLDNKYRKSQVPRPKNWGGYQIIPDRIEFWQGRPSRLHDRLLYLLNDNIWTTQRLSP